MTDRPGRERRYRKTAAWARLRAVVLERDGYRCRMCGDPGSGPGGRGLTLHHVVPRSLGGPDEEANLVLLCARDHGRLHGGAHDR